MLVYEQPRWKRSEEKIAGFGEGGEGLQVYIVESVQDIIVPNVEGESSFKPTKSL